MVMKPTGKQFGKNITVPHSTCECIIAARKVFINTMWWLLYPTIMMASSDGNIFHVTDIFCVGNSPVTGESPSQSPVALSFDVFFGLHLSESLRKQSGLRGFGMPSPYYDVTVMDDLHPQSAHCKKWTWHIDVYFLYKCNPPAWWILR